MTWMSMRGGCSMAEKKTAAKMENHSAEIVTQLLKKGKKVGVKKIRTIGI